MPQVWYVKFLGPAFLCGVWYTSDHFMPILRCVYAFIVWILHKLRCASGLGHCTTSETAQTNIRLGKIWYSDVCAWSVLHSYRSYSYYVEARSRANYCAAYKMHCGRRDGCDCGFASDVQRLT